VAEPPAGPQQGTVHRVKPDGSGQIVWGGSSEKLPFAKDDVADAGACDVDGRLSRGDEVGVRLGGIITLNVTRRRVVCLIMHRAAVWAS